MRMLQEHNTTLNQTFHAAHHNVASYSQTLTGYYECQSAWLT